MNWGDRERNGDIYWFFKQCIAFRLAHPILRNGYFLRGEDYQKRGYPDISWHGSKVGKPNWAKNSHRLAFMLWGEYAKGSLFWDMPIYVAMNLHWEAHEFELPSLPKAMAWHCFANTGDPYRSIHEVWHEPRLENQVSFPMQSRSVLILVGK
jgi:glycogen operon protein